jgi:hypothetical protein
LDKKELDEAIQEYRAAIALDPKDALPHGALGQMFLELGRFAEAGKSTRRCLDLMQRDHPLRQFASRQLEQCDQLLVLDQKLVAILAGTAKPANDAERVALAWLCQQPYKRRYAASAHFYAEAIDAKPDLANNPGSAVRYNAACAAALAGCGQGNDADRLDDNEGARLRQQALGWLKADLALWAEQADSKNAKVREAVQQKMKHWQSDADLAGERDQTGLAKLPDAERESWEKLWAEVEALRKKAGESK